MHVVFDLDGVLIDTEEVVARCYAHAGATPPRSILAHENSDWLIDQVDDPDVARVIKSRKDECYLNTLRSGDVRWLSGTFVAQELYRDGHRVHLLTGAPTGTVVALRELWGVRFPDTPWPFGITFDGMKTPAKMRSIQLLATRSSGRHGVYVDDQDKFIDLPSTWKFVHFTDHTESVPRLVARILGNED